MEKGFVFLGKGASILQEPEKCSLMKYHILPWWLHEKLVDDCIDLQLDEQHDLLPSQPPTQMLQRPCKNPRARAVLRQRSPSRRPLELRSVVRPARQRSRKRRRHPPEQDEIKSEADSSEPGRYFALLEDVPERNAAVDETEPVVLRSVARGDDTEPVVLRSVARDDSDDTESVVLRSVAREDTKKDVKKEAESDVGGTTPTEEPEDDIFVSLTHEEPGQKAAPPMLPPFAAMGTFMELVTEAAAWAGGSWPSFVESQLASMPEMDLPEKTPRDPLFQLGICMCSMHGAQQLEVTLPLLLFGLLPFMGFVRVYLMIPASEQETLLLLLLKMEACLRMRLLILLVTDCHEWHYAEWYNCVLECACNDGATIVCLTANIEKLGNPE